MLVTLCAGLLALSGCSTAVPDPKPTIGSPSPTAAPTSAAMDRALQLARTWKLTGAPLPEDWPDVPLPKGAEVVTAYAIGSPPRRTWTATFTTDSGTALDLAEPVVAALRKREYVPIAQYVGAAETNTGLYSFAAPTFAVYVVLGEDDGQPNVVLTIRGSSGSVWLDEIGGRPTTGTGAPTPASPAASSPSPSGAPGTTPSADVPPSPTGSPGA
jgi:hypothetical protein